MEIHKLMLKINDPKRDFFTEEEKLFLLGLLYDAQGATKRIGPRIIEGPSKFPMDISGDRPERFT